MNDVFHPQHISCIKASELAFEDCLCAKRWKDAIEYGSLCLESYKKYTLGDQVRSLQRQLHFVYKKFAYYFQVWGNLGLLNYRLALAHENNNMVDDDKSSSCSEDRVRVLLNEAQKVLVVTHGQDHQLYKEVTRKLSGVSNV